MTYEIEDEVYHRTDNNTQQSATKDIARIVNPKVYARKGIDGSPQEERQAKCAISYHQRYESKDSKRVARMA
jgi:hypothetical protein